MGPIPLVFNARQIWNPDRFGKFKSSSMSAGEAEIISSKAVSKEEILSTEYPSFLKYFVTLHVGKRRPQQ